MLNPAILALWATYGLSAAGTVWLARRFAGSVSRGAAILLVLLPLLFTGKAMLLGRLYGPADLYSSFDPWRAAAEARAAPAPVNPILSDLAFANIPWRAAVRESIANGRFPFWNRFVLAGNPLLAAAQAGIFHPATWLGILLPLPLSWTFSCAFTIFLALLSAFLYFRDGDATEGAAMFGAVGWAFSTYVLFWVGWSVGPSTATFPLLLLGLRRIVRGGERGVALTVAGILLSLFGGHPESLLHTVAAAGVVFLIEIARLARRAGAASARLPLRRAAAAGVLAFLLSGPQLFPILEAIPHTSEYRERRARLDAGAAAHSQSVPAGEALSRMRPALLPFAHGIYGRSPVQEGRADGSGMPLAYGGALLFPFAFLGLSERRPGRAVFAGLAAAGLLLGASAPGLIDALTSLPGFALALNYRLVFLAPFGFAGLAAFGVDAARRKGGARRLAIAAFATVAVVGAGAWMAKGVFRERDLSPEFVAGSLAAELSPVLLLAATAVLLASRRDLAARRGMWLVPAAVLLLCGERVLELGGVYPAQDGRALAPPAVELEIVRAAEASGVRVTAPGSVLRPNGAALYGVEDVRGYESIVLDRFADTYPLWCLPQPASFNRVDDLSRPFLSFLGARFAATAPDAPDASVPPGWVMRFRGPDLALFENPAALPRAFAPARVSGEIDPRATLAAMAAASPSEFSRVVWVRGVPAGRDLPNPSARVACRSDGPDLVLDTESPAPFFAMTSLPDWPGWHAREGGSHFALATADHAFVGVWLPAGRHRVRLTYSPPSFPAGLAACALGIAAIAASLAFPFVARPRRPSLR